MYYADLMRARSAAILPHRGATVVVDAYFLVIVSVIKVANKIGHTVKMAPASAAKFCPKSNWLLLIQKVPVHFFPSVIT